MLSENLRNGLKVKVTKLGKGEGLFVVPRHLEARKENVTGVLHQHIPGHGGDGWFVVHDNSQEIGAYWIDELDPVSDDMPCVLRVGAVTAYKDGKNGWVRLNVDAQGVHVKFDDKLTSPRFYSFEAIDRALYVPRKRLGSGGRTVLGIHGPIPVKFENKVVCWISDIDHANRSVTVTI